VSHCVWVGRPNELSPTCTSERSGSRSASSCRLAIEIMNENVVQRAVEDFTGSSVAFTAATGTLYTVRGDECTLNTVLDDHEMFGPPGMPVDLDGEPSVFVWTRSASAGIKPAETLNSLPVARN
jgi:hypothetical protein